MDPSTQAAGATPQAGAFSDTLSEEEVRLTPAARRKLADIMGSLDEDEAEAVRMYVTGAGCSGMTYGMTFADRRTPYDCVLEADGVRVYIDAVALNYLRGVEIDYQELPEGESFVFNNVFAATGGSGACSACGGAMG
ncbi:MAG: iron-sulfur cluster assembly accessory protein [Gammaproteobacteria bacterium]|nr:iron-sulfur cluster assembly accessory protein [Gammaproteobacteria bacterium]